MAGVGLFVLLHAFANGCTAMTGVEPISNGIIVLTLFAIALVVIFGGSVFRLIPLYAVGVFLSVVYAVTGRHGDALETAS